MDTKTESVVSTEQTQNAAMPGRIDQVRKILAAVGCALMLFSILFPFLRMTDPNGDVTDMSRRETFAVGMEGWDAGPYIIWALILLACALILYFQLKDQRKKSRHGCGIAFLIVVFDALTIAGFVVQYGPYEVSCFPLAGFWLLLAGWLVSWIASFLHKRKKKPKKNRKRRSGRTGLEYSENIGNPYDPGTEEEDDAGEAETDAGASGKKLYRQMKKQQKLEREERMRKAAEQGKNEK